MKIFLKLPLIALSLTFVMCSAGNENNNNKNKNAMEANATTTGKVIHLTTQQFKDLVFDYTTSKEWKYKGELPAIVDFYATWCGPCKMVAPILDELAKEYDGKIVIYKVDTDKEQELAGAFGIQSIPTIVFIPKVGQPQASMGALPKATFVTTINDVLLK